MGVTVKYQRGAWWVFVAHRNQRKAKRIGVSREAAKRVAQAIEERLARADLGLPLPLSMETLRMYAERWLAGAGRSLKGSTVRFYRDNLANHIYPALGSVPLSAVSRRDVKHLLVALAGKGSRRRPSPESCGRSARSCRKPSKTRSCQRTRPCDLVG